MDELDLPSKSELQPIVDVFKTMSDPTRMRIILAVANGPITVSAIANLLDLSSSNVSHQLRLLRQQRLVVGERSDKQIYYRLIDEHVLQIYDLTKTHIEEKNEQAQK
ncbi:metalloregulator ArsR/SmtB family transcription factor [Xylocopilactobacillus apicola]|nr:metalloregulator ArsR/SmtB family transcription factor [Xylocopilactobacillus apicola]